LHVPYEDGIKEITRQQRLYLARERFEKFICSKEGRTTKAVLAHYEKNGFTGMEIAELQPKYGEWWVKSHKRPKQGRVADKENDARLQPRLPREFGRIVEAIAEEHGSTKIDVLDTLATTAGHDSIRRPAKPITLTKDEKAKLHKAALRSGWVEKLP